MQSRHLTSQLVTLILTLLAAVSYATAKDLPPPAEASPLVRANNRFGLRLLRELHQRGENSCVSPPSLALSLHMLSTRSTGETRAELEGALGTTGLDLGELDRTLLQALEQHAEVRVRLVNALWSNVSQGALSEDTSRELLANFGIHARTLNFADRSSGDAIARWLKERTEGTLGDRVPRVPQEGRLALSSAATHDARWSLAFLPEGTRPGTFVDVDGKASEVTLMLGIESYRSFGRYSREEPANVVCLPYGADRSVGMWVAVPKPGVSLAELVDQLSEDTLAHWNERANAHRTYVYLPRFDLATQHDVRPALERMGVKRLFQAGPAVLPELGSAPAAEIELLPHQTAVRFANPGVRRPVTDFVPCHCLPTEVKCDRPFLFVIQDFKTGSILFAGTVYRP
ncbi:MAG: serpin family protein [Planctomycetota bacterium]